MKRAADITPTAERLANIEAQEQGRQASLKTLRRLRAEARAEIERLIAFLDASDIDPDLEDDGSDEPWLGWNERGSTTWIVDDREEDAGDGPECDCDSFEGDSSCDDEEDPSGIADEDGLLEQGCLHWGPCVE